MKEDRVRGEHLRFAVLAADVVLFTIRDNRLLVRLIKVNRPPHFRIARVCRAVSLTLKKPPRKRFDASSSRKPE
jgi:hypothetical protein